MKIRVKSENKEDVLNYTAYTIQHYANANTMFSINELREFLRLKHSHRIAKYIRGLDMRPHNTITDDVMWMCTVLAKTGQLKHKGSQHYIAGDSREVILEWSVIHKLYKKYLENRTK